MFMIYTVGISQLIPIGYYLCMLSILKDMFIFILEKNLRILSNFLYNFYLFLKILYFERIDFDSVSTLVISS